MKCKKSPDGRRWLNVSGTRILQGGTDLRVVLFGSSPLLVQQELSESLAGRFEILRVGHWSFSEMRDAFGLTVDQYLYFGGYPGATPLIHDEERWRRYLLD